VFWRLENMRSKEERQRQRDFPEPEECLLETGGAVM
jgi:hypothetical protein